MAERTPAARPETACTNRHLRGGLRRALFVVLTLLGPIDARAQDDDVDTQVYFRAGLDAGFAPGFAETRTTPSSLVLGLVLHGRIGVQVGDHFAAYYEPALLFGPYNAIGSPQGNIVGHVSSLLAEVSVADILQLAIGPAVAGAHVGGGGFSDGMVGLGLTGRVALCLGTSRPGPRHAFSIGLVTHLAWVIGGPGWLGLLALSVGWDMY